MMMLELDIPARRAPPPGQERPRPAHSRLLRYHLKRLRWLLATRLDDLLKRALDVAAVILALPLVGPVLFVAGALIKLTDGGPVLFWQRRVGRRGRLFDFPKLRSMVPDAESLRPRLDALNEHQSGVTFKIRRDPRITWIGRIVRRWSIDELPQLWCVLTGDMSLVGPRPALPSEVCRYSQPERRRLDAVPGLTCLWQISGRADVPFDRQVVLDISYIQSWSFLRDLWILLMTVPAVLSGRGAY